MSEHGMSEAGGLREAAEALAKVLAEHLPRDRYRDDGEAIGTYCTCGGWTGNYFADGEFGPFDRHLATVLAAREAKARATLPEPDNHHNALACPYCTNDLDDRLAKARVEAGEQIARRLRELPTTRTKAWDKGWDSISLKDALAACIAREVTQP